jgi:hypothetical protein
MHRIAFCITYDFLTYFAVKLLSYNVASLRKLKIEIYNFLRNGLR